MYRWAGHITNCIHPAVGVPQKKAGEQSPAGPPLRRVENIVIWEGNYSSDILFIGALQIFFNSNVIFPPSFTDALFVTLDNKN